MWLIICGCSEFNIVFVESTGLLFGLAKIGPDAIPKPTKMASTGRFGQIVMAVMVLTAAGPISIPIVGRNCGGRGPANKRCKIRISNKAHPPRPIPQTKHPKPGYPMAFKAAPPTRPPGTIGRYRAGVTWSAGILPMDKRCTTRQAMTT